MGKLSSKTVPISSLASNDIRVMFNLFTEFYEDCDFQQFEKDMLCKDKIILLLDKQEIIRGFSTLTTFTFNHAGKKQRVLYSGDTIIDPRFWGSAALTMEFLKNIILEKMLHLNTKVYWFLISKGYKTYLLMANNFIHYSPRYDRKTPESIEGLKREIAQKVFPHVPYDNGILRYQHEKLKSFVAPITETMRGQYPKIAYFEYLNPGWEDGDELVCLAEVNLALAIVHPMKVMSKRSRKILHSLKMYLSTKRP